MNTDWGKWERGQVQTSQSSISTIMGRQRRLMWLALLGYLVLTALLIAFLGINEVEARQESIVREVAFADDANEEAVEKTIQTTLGEAIATLKSEGCIAGAVSVIEHPKIANYYIFVVQCTAWREDAGLGARP